MCRTVAVLHRPSGCKLAPSLSSLASLARPPALLPAGPDYAVLVEYNETQASPEASTFSHDPRLLEWVRGAPAFALVRAWPGVNFTYGATTFQTLLSAESGSNAVFVMRQSRYAREVRGTNITVHTMVRRAGATGAPAWQNLAPDNRVNTMEYLELSDLVALSGNRALSMSNACSWWLSRLV